MTTLKLILSKTVEEEIEEIQLPLFDIIEHDEETWFTEAIKKLEE